MAKKTARKTTKKVAHHTTHRHFRPSYKAHPAWHLTSGALLLILLGLIVFSMIVYFGTNTATLYP